MEVGGRNFRSASSLSCETPTHGCPQPPFLLKLQQGGEMHSVLGCTEASSLLFISLEFCP